MNSDEKLLIHRLLKKHENILDGTLGNFTCIENIELLEGAQPYWHIQVYTAVGSVEYDVIK